MATKKNGTVEKQEIDALKKVIEVQGKTINVLRKHLDKVTNDFGELAADFLEISENLDNLTLKAHRTVSKYGIGSSVKIERGVQKESFLEELMRNIESVKEEVGSLGNEKP